jgi:hypothetical protein
MFCLVQLAKVKEALFNVYAGSANLHSQFLLILLF